MIEFNTELIALATGYTQREIRETDARWLRRLMKLQKYIHEYESREAKKQEILGKRHHKMSY